MVNSQKRFDDALVAQIPSTESPEIRTVSEPKPKSKAGPKIFLALGGAFIPLGIAVSPVFLAVGATFFVIGLASLAKERKEAGRTPEKD